MSIQPKSGELAGCGQPTNGDELPNLEEYRRAIKDSGYLLEVRVANVLRERGYLMTPNSPIPHPEESSELIEIDVEATDMYMASDGTWSSTETTLLIECKLNSQPIAFFSQPEQSPGTNACLMAYYADPISDSHDLLDFMAIEKWHHYARSVTVASQFCSFKKQGQGKITTDPCPTYRESLNRLCMATAANSLRSKGSSPERNRIDGYFIRFVYPILVAAGPLLSVITEAEGPRLAREDHILLHRGARVGGNLHEYLIDVVTERALPTLLDTIQAEAEILARWAKAHRDYLLAPPTKRVKKRSKDAAVTPGGKSSNKTNRDAPTRAKQPGRGEGHPARS
jgi:hypothetical protein